jgi:hypothetical protein
MARGEDAVRPLVSAMLRQGDLRPPDRLVVAAGEEMREPHRGVHGMPLIEAMMQGRETLKLLTHTSVAILVFRQAIKLAKRVEAGTS